jgi:hypothetical protein
MRNPFEYGGVVSGEAFCNRQQEIADLVRAMENAQKLFVFSGSPKLPFSRRRSHVARSVFEKVH